jgi:S1-C subfamily serine protease
MPIRLGSSDAVSVKDPVLILTHEGDPFTSALVVSRRTFTGYWEYILENALYTVPAIPNFAGAALVDREFALIGVGSLFVNNAVDPDINVPGNLFIPIDALKPILPDLMRNGRAAGPARPWLGVNVIEQFGRVVIVRVTKEGPAERAGLGVGDLIFEVAGQRVNSAEEFFRAVWRQGNAGVAVPLKVLQQHSVRDVSIASGDRYRFYRVHPLN